MIKDTIDSMIAEAMKNHEAERLETLRMIKSTLVKAEKDGVVLNEVSEGKIIQKMIKQTEDAIEQFKKAGRDELVKKESADLEVIKQFAPKEVSEEDVMAATILVCSKLEEEGQTINMSVMKQVMEKVQGIHPTASGKIISQVVRNWKK